MKKFIAYLTEEKALQIFRKNELIIKKNVQQHNRVEMHFKVFPFRKNRFVV